jgi:hypothetical protein
MLGLNVDNLLAGFKKDLSRFEARTDSMADDLTAIRVLLETLVEQGKA